jgi:hypothetical protein
MYNKNKKQSRYTILVNYLSNINKNNQFKNRYKIEQSIKKKILKWKKLYQSLESCLKQIQERRKLYNGLENLSSKRLNYLMKITMCYLKKLN